MTRPFTDHVFQNVKLYIEGVQVPFIAISVTSGRGGLPTASVSIPAQAGLMDIARFYNPKIHIFYTDILNEYEDEAEADKLLFSGIVAQVQYNKSKDVNSSVGITLNCVHRYSLINDMLVDYTGWLTADPLQVEDSAGTKVDTANSQATVIDALAGIKDPNSPGGTEITEDNPTGQSFVLPERYKVFYNRLLGMPGVMINFWNQMKRSAFNRELRQGDLFYSEPFVKMYKPLAEDGLKFFDRLGGHYPVEALVQADQYRVDPCPDTPGKKEKIVIPPSRQVFLSSAVQAEMTIANVATYLQNSGEITTIYQIFNNFYESIDYEMVTLASPAEVSIRPNTIALDDGSQEDLSPSGKENETFALDTLIKPNLPFYFSPTCNVLFPGMYRSINVMYDEINVPTRVLLKNLEGPNQDGYRSNFRAPHSIREATARKSAGVNGKAGFQKDAKYSLTATLGQSYGAIGLYEQGRGLKQELIHMPRWLSHFSQSTAGGNRPVKDVAPDSSTEQGRVEALKVLAKGWTTRYPGDSRATLNPYALDADVSAHHRMLFSAADYYYTQTFARSKAGSVECPFNPHIVPGYPMDILEANPIYPSFHALCSSVTHTITESSAQTNVQFVAAVTYAELTNYYMPMVSPMLQVALGLAENPTLIGADETTIKTANEFYFHTLGTGAVAPDAILDVGRATSTGRVIPQKMSPDGTWTTGSEHSLTNMTNGGEMNPMLSYLGNLSLTYRNIETRKKVEERFDIKFIDMSPANYGPTVMSFRDKNLNNATRYEIGRSQFLTYSSYFGQLVETQNTTGVATTVDRGGNIIQTTDLTTGKVTTTKGI